MSLRVAVLCADGPYQWQLVRRVAEQFELVGVVVHAPPQPKGSLSSRLARYRDPQALSRYLQVRAFLPKFEREAEPLRSAVFPTLDPRTIERFPTVRVPDVNDPAAVALLERVRPDIVLVNGTNLLRKPVLGLQSRIPLGILNLHTGLSPYSRGGNCNLFMLLEGRPELVGITVHYISGGIDSGDIVLSSQLPMTADDNFEMVDIRGFDYGFDALLAAAGQVAQGVATRVPQWEPGKLFLRRTGYVYEPYHRLQANRLLEQGLVREYLADREARDRDIRVIGEFG